MAQSGGGEIVVLSGGGATAPLPTLSAYAASKSAIVRLVETFAKEVETLGISVNALAPGVLATDMREEILNAGPQLVDSDFYDRMVVSKMSGEDSTPTAVEAISFLLANRVPGLTGRLIAAKWDPWRDWARDPSELTDGDAYTLRRKVP